MENKCLKFRASKFKFKITYHIKIVKKYKNKLLKVADSFSRSFSSDTHQEKTSVRRKVIERVNIYSVRLKARN